MRSKVPSPKVRARATTLSRLAVPAVLLALGTGCGGATGSSRPVAEPTIDLGPAPDSHPASPAVVRAEALLGADRAQDAVALLEAAVGEAPGDARAQFTLGVARTLVGDATRAEAAFRAALRIDAAYAEAWNELGLMLRDDSRLTDAVEALRTAVRVRPEFHDAWYNLALVLEDTDDVAGASEAFDRALPGLGNDPVVRFHRAGLYLRTGDAPAAERELLRARSLATGRTDVLRAIARTFASAGNPNAAADTLDMAVAGASTPDANLLVEAAGASRSARRAIPALNHARRAVDAAPDSPRAHAMLALVAADAGQRGEARTALEAATRLDTAGALRADLERLRALVEAMP